MSGLREPELSASRSFFASRSGRNSSRNRRPDGPDRTRSPLPPSDPPASSTMSPSRKVRTVPPSAIFDPPESPAQALPSENQAESSTAARQRPRPRLRYSTSDDDASESDDSEREPEFWTFTPAGMQKLMAKSQRRMARLKNGISGGEGDGVSKVRDAGSKTPRPAKREGRIRGSMYKRSSRSDADTPLRTGIKLPSRRNSPIKLPKFTTTTPLFQPKPTRDSSQSHIFRKTFALDTPDPLVPPPPIQRSNSAPTAPDDTRPLQRPVSDIERPLASDTDDSLARMAKPRTKRLASAPNFSPFRRHRDEALTDSETAMSKSPRHRSAMFHNPMSSLGGALDEEGDTRSSSTNSVLIPNPPRPSRQNQHHRLRLTIPPPLQQRLSHWQQPGTWVDAMYDDYGVADRTKSGPKDMAEVLSDSPKLNSRRQSRTNSKDTPTTPSMAWRRSSVESSPAAQAPKTRRKRRRYRTALVPPTPGGLGFIPTEIKTLAEPTGFDWELSTTHERNPTEDTVGPSSSIPNEKPTPPSPKAPWWRFGKNKNLDRVAAKKRFKEETNRRERLKVRMFSDVRVTIYFRLVNLAVVALSLGLAISIRSDLHQLSLPGLMGPSTTLIISFASFTIAHILTAIYREYKGRPIGLWDLHSKMLWVCLDLLFVALWAVASGMSINDYLSTPLECSPLDEWWTSGLADGYARIMLELGNSTAFAQAIASARVSNLLGLALPDSITGSDLAAQACNRQIGEIVLSLSTLILYASNMVVSLFRIFETVRRTNEGRSVGVV